MRSRRSALLALPLALLPVGLVVGAAPSADAAGGPAWHTILTLNGGRLQACKVSLDADTWKVRVRVDARDLTGHDGRLRGTAVGTQGGNPRGATWTGSAAKGNVSQPGAVKVAKGAANGVTFTMRTDNAGNGTNRLVAKIGAC